MRKARSLATLLGGSRRSSRRPQLAAYVAGRSAPRRADPAAAARRARSPLVNERQAHDRHRQPGLPAVVRRRRGRRARSGRSTTRRPARASSPRSRTPSRSSSASRSRRWSGRTCRSTARTRPARSRSTSTSTRSRSRRPARRSSTSARSYYDVNQAIVVLKGTPIAKAQAVAGLRELQARRRSSARRATTTSRTQIKPSTVAGGLPAERRRGAGAEEQADRRPRRRPADRVLRHRRPGAERRRSSASSRPRSAASTSGWCFAKGSPLAALRRQGDRDAEGERHARANPAAVAGEGDRRAGPEVAARRRLRAARLGDRTGRGGGGRRSVAIALASTVVFVARRRVRRDRARPAGPRCKARVLRLGRVPRRRCPRSRARSSST